MVKRDESTKKHFKSLNQYYLIYMLKMGIDLDLERRGSIQKNKTEIIIGKRIILYEKRRVINEGLF